MASVPAEQWASTSELERGLSDPEPEERALAIESLVERWGERALDKVLEALLDPDDYVRGRALDAASDAGIERRAGQLQHLASADRSDEVRHLALQNFAEHSEVSDADVDRFSRRSSSIRVRASKRRRSRFRNRSSELRSSVTERSTFARAC